MSYSDIFNYDKYLLDNYNQLEDSYVDTIKVHWEFLSCQWRNKLPEDFILRFKDYLNWETLLMRGNLSEKVILEGVKVSSFNSRVYLTYCKKIYPITLTIIKRRRFIYRLEMYNISRILDLQYVKDNASYVDWEIISERKDLTEDFVMDNLSSLHLRSVLEFSNIGKNSSEEFISKLKLLVELSR